MSEKKPPAPAPVPTGVNGERCACPKPCHTYDCDPCCYCELPTGHNAPAPSERCACGHPVEAHSQFGCAAGYVSGTPCPRKSDIPLTIRPAELLAAATVWARGTQMGEVLIAEIAALRAEVERLDFQRNHLDTMVTALTMDVQSAEARADKAEAEVAILRLDNSTLRIAAQNASDHADEHKARADAAEREVERLTRDAEHGCGVDCRCIELEAELAELRGKK